MTFSENGRVREWECCGHIWQLVLSSLFPERESWYPVCPNCGQTGEAVLELRRKLEHSTFKPRIKI